MSRTYDRNTPPSSSASSRCSSSERESPMDGSRRLPISDLGALGKYRMHVARRALQRRTFAQWVAAVAVHEREAESKAMRYLIGRAGKRRPSQRSDPDNVESLSYAFDEDP